MNCTNTQDLNGGIQRDPSGGRLSIGPFKDISLQDIYEAMDQYGIQLSLEESPDDHQVTTFTSVQGMSLLVTGSGVQAYLLGEDGFEICCDELDDFFLEVLPDGGSCVIEGEHSLGEGASFINKSLYMRDGKNIHISDLRSKAVACGAIQALRGVESPSLKICV